MWNQRKARALALLWVLLDLSCLAHGLKCRTTQESQLNGDFEYVVRMCLRRLRNESDFTENLHNVQTDYESSRNKRHRDDVGNDNRNYYDRNRNNGYPEGFDRFWSSNDKPYSDRYRYGDDNRSRPDGDYEDGEPEYYDTFRNGKEGRKKSKPRQPAPHSYQQQMQHDREMYNRGNRDPSNYFYPNRNKNPKFMFNKDKSESPLAEIDPCVIHCIFKEMQMVGNNGKPNKGLISQMMTQKIRNSELKTFIEDSVDECFEFVDDVDSGGYSSSNSNRRRKPEATCEWAKTFAMCLEDRGKENCDDWSDAIQKNNIYNNNNNNNNGNSSNNNNNKNNEDQKHKSKQNDRG